MPRRYFAPYRGRRRRYNRSTAAATIGRAWRKKLKRRTGGLVSRTALSNRRSIRKMKKCIETKMLQGVQVTSAGEFDGQTAENIIVDNEGEFTATSLPYSNDILSGLTQGTGSNQRVGAWIHLKNVTIHYCITADKTSPQCHYNLLLVHDQDPEAQANLTDLLELDCATPPVQNWTQMAFQDLNVTGKENRYKILWRKTHVVSCENPLADSTQAVPPITTTPAGVAPNIYGNVQRAGYSNQPNTSANKQYPLAVYGAKTWKFQYKINYGTDAGSTKPVNQSLKLFAFQTAPVGYRQPSARLDYYIRVRYNDD